MYQAYYSLAYIRREVRLGDLIIKPESATAELIGDSKLLS